MRTWITGSLKPCTLDDPEVVPNTVYNKLLEQQTNSATRYLQGWNHGCGRVSVRQDLRVVCTKCATEWKMMMHRNRPIYRFTVNKMILKYQSGAKARTNERYDETSERKNCEIQQIKPDEFLRAEVWAHDGWSSGLIRLLEFLGLEAEGHQDYEQFWELRGRLHWDMQKISPRQMWPVFWP